MFPHRLNDSRAFGIAQALLDGFDRHYRLFRDTSASAKQRFEAADWHGQGPPGHVVCSSYVSWCYRHVGLDAPAGERSVTPADWTEFCLVRRFNV